MLPNLTIQIFDGGAQQALGQQSLQSLNMFSPVLTTRSQAPTTLEVRLPGYDPAAAPLVAYGTKVKFYYNGAIVFSGTQRADRRTAYGQSRECSLTFYDPWWDLQHLVYQQLWTWKLGGVMNPTRRFSRLVLFQTLNALFRSNGAEIQNVINWAISCGVSCQLGTVQPSMLLPPKPVQAAMCSEAIVMCLKTQPDAAAFFDGTTDPPTFKCLLRANLPAVAYPFAGTDAAGRDHLATQISPRYDLQVPQVVVDYEKTTTITVGASTNSATDFFSDAYPVGSNGQSVGSLVLPVDLRGEVLKELAGTVTSEAFDPTHVAFWKEKKPDLATGKVRGLSVLGGYGDPTHPITVLDDNGNPVNLATYGFLLTDGVVNPWMFFDQAATNPVLSTDATVTADLNWQEWSADAGGFQLKGHGTNGSKRVSVRVKLTNSPAGAITYYSNITGDTGESSPPGLAQAIWNSFSLLHWEGRHEVLERDEGISHITGPWEALNVTGGAAAWATMAATIQEAEHDFYNGKTRISFGPPAHVNPTDLAEALVFFRFRLVNDSITTQPTGLTSGGGVGGSESAKLVPKENTVNGPEANELFVLGTAQVT